MLLKPAIVCVLSSLVWGAGDAFAQRQADVPPRPLSAPQVSFPARAVSENISGFCDVRFTVDDLGWAQDVTAKCSNRLFCADARRAISRTGFSPGRKNGEVVAYENVVYPILFAQPGSNLVQDPDLLTDC